MMPVGIACDSGLVFLAWSGPTGPDPFVMRIRIPERFWLFFVVSKIGGDRKSEQCSACFLLSLFEA